MYIIESIRIFFLRLNNIPLYVNTTLCLFIHPSANIWFASTFQQLWILLLWTWMYKYLETLLSVLCVMYSGVELLDQMIILFKKFWVTIVPFFTVAVPFSWYIPTSRTKGLQFFHILGNICFLFFFFFLIVATVVLIPIRMTTVTTGYHCAIRLFSPLNLWHLCQTVV